ncbi:MAG: GmrSD restriction endonuclease domain-containing protein [Candidatus Caldarchaeales archaeon]|jgi:hypothetical protein
MPSSTVVPLSELYKGLKEGQYVVPDIQREFVWDNSQVREFAESIRKRLPIGVLYVCEMSQDLIENYSDLFKPITDDSEVRRGKYIVIDGRQRLTSLLLIKYGRVKVANKERRLELYFNAYDKSFQLARSKKRPAGCWFKVSEVLQADSVDGVMNVVDSVDCSNVNRNVVIESLLDLWNVFRIYQVPIVNVAVEWDVDDLIKGFERLSEMFVILNSKGTKVKLQDLVLALITGKTIAGGVESFRKTFHNLITELIERGYDVDSPPVIRAYLAISTGKVKFKEASQELNKLSPLQYLDYLEDTKESLLKCLELMKEFGIRPGFLESVYLPVIPAVAIYKRYIASKKPIDERFKMDLVTWLVYASFDKRYTGRLESDLSEDISTLSESSYDISALLKNLRIRSITEEDLTSEYENRHLTLLSVLYAQNKAKDWDVESTNPKKIVDIPDNEISVHHIFPKVVLKKSGYDEELWNDVGNITLISKTANEKFKEEPLSYLKKLKEADPAFLELHFVPTDENLWRIENYEEFLKRRRQLILQACKTLFTTTTG